MSEEYIKGDAEQLEAHVTRTIRIRKSVIVAGGIVAVGLGAYFGSKSGLKGVQKALEAMQKELSTATAVLNRVRISSENLMDAHELEILGKMEDQEVISTAKKLKVKFEYYPGLGVFFPTLEDKDIVKKALNAPFEQPRTLSAS